jgi:hypothetical protein
MVRVPSGRTIMANFVARNTYEKNKCRKENGILKRLN